MIPLLCILAFLTVAAYLCRKPWPRVAAFGWKFIGGCR